MIEYELRTYQAKAAADVVKRVRQGMAEPGDTIATLSAPTGAGKTIIAAAAIDELLHGNDTSPGDLGLVILWFSMSPALNEQTAAKFARASSKLAERTRVIDTSAEYAGPSLDPGRIYFLNPQKLGRGATQYRAGDHRKRDLWDTLNGTVERHGARVIVFVDEAHQGTGSNAAGDATYLSQFLNGTGLGKQKAPVVIGVSATPDRFDKGVTGRSTKTSITVDINEVRIGGLVKDKILLGHPTEEIASDVTLLMEAARQRTRMAHLWAQYTEQNDEPPVEPILLVQMPANVPELTVAGWLDAIMEADRTLVAANIINALQDKTVQTYGSHDVRYVDPPRIQETPNAKVVLFKDALTTGWDCPRAEVLISMRGSKDDTTITQLIGRTVRTPLAKKVAGDEELNAVRVYLPHFDDKTVEGVIGRLRDGDDAIASDVIAKPVRVVRNPEVPAEAWGAFDAFPTWTRPVRTARSTTSRLVTASMVLSRNDVLEDAPSIAQRHIVDTLLSHFETNREWVENKVEEYTDVDYVTRAVDWMTGEQVGAEDAKLAIASRNILDLYKQAKSRMPDASAAWLWEHLVNEGVYEDKAEARLVVAALAQQPDTTKAVEDAARSLLQQWKQQHLADLGRLGGQAQQDFLAVFIESKVSEEVTTTLPEPTNVAAVERTWQKHLLAAETDFTLASDVKVSAGTFPFKPANTWEDRTLTAEVELHDTVAWYRNPTGGPHAIAVPYGEPGNQRMLYPDFVIFTRRADGSIAIGIVDPHRPDLGDTLPKWLALGKYAEQNADRLQRVWAVIDDKDTDGLLFLDLSQPAARAALQAADAAGGGEQRIRKAFARAGGRYS